MNRAERRAMTKAEIKNSKLFNECVRESGKVLGSLFKDNPEKIVYWLYTANPKFGGLCPAQYMHMRPDKYLAFIKSPSVG